MEKKKTNPLIYVVLIAVIAGLGVFIVHRIQQNNEDRKAIDKTMSDLHKMETGTP